MEASTDLGPFEATILATFSVSGRGRFVEVEIIRGSIVVGAFVSIETSEGERLGRVHAIEYVDHRVRNPPEGHVALGVSGLDEHATPVIGGVVRRVYACPCCRHLTLSERGGFEICPVCGWEDDGQDDDDAQVVHGGPNGTSSLLDARASFARIGAVDERARQHVRPPREAERPH